MACPGGCVAGAGTNIAVAQAMKEVNNFKANSEVRLPKMEGHDE
jgi:iron only hydrogenase large subunit-like protein